MWQASDLLSPDFGSESSSYKKICRWRRGSLNSSSCVLLRLLFLTITVTLLCCWGMLSNAECSFGYQGPRAQGVCDHILELFLFLTSVISLWGDVWVSPSGIIILLIAVYGGTT